MFYHHIISIVFVISKDEIKEDSKINGGGDGAMLSVVVCDRHGISLFKSHFIYRRFTICLR